MSISALDKVRERNIPFYALIELTHRCNLRCCHCYLPANESPDELSADQFKDVLDQLADAGTLFITFSGGEAFLRDDFFEIATYAREKNFAIRILTNGTLIDEKIANKIKDLNPFGVDVSIYGQNGKLHDGITNLSGSFGRSVGGIRFLKQKGIEVAIKTPLMKSNVDRYKEIISLADKFKVKYELNPIISPKLSGSCEPLSYRIDELQLLEVFSDELINPDILKIKEEPCTLKKSEDLLMCGAGRNSCLISPAGEIFPCAILRIPFGNVRKQPFSEIWHSFEARKFRDMKFSDLRTCTQCELLAYCDRCPGIALLEDGDIFGPARFFCKIAEVRKSINEERLGKINQERGGAFP